MAESNSELDNISKLELFVIGSTPFSKFSEDPISDTDEELKEAHSDASTYLTKNSKHHVIEADFSDWYLTDEKEVITDTAKDCIQAIRQLNKQQYELYDGHISILNTISLECWKALGGNGPVLNFVTQSKLTLQGNLPCEPRPDICAIWTTSFETEIETPCWWHRICSVVEAKTGTLGTTQLTAYGIRFLMAKPDYTAVLGFSMGKKGYFLSYIDSSTVHFSPRILWKGIFVPQSYIFQTYKRSWQNPLIVDFTTSTFLKTRRILRSDGIVHFMTGESAQGGLGRHHFTVILVRRVSSPDNSVQHHSKYIKVIMPNLKSRFWEGDLFGLTHTGGYISGLARAHSSGSLPGHRGGPIKSSEHSSTDKRALYQLIVNDVRLGLEDNRRSVYHILRVFYDVLASLCNLFHRGIIHRDISMHNIMLTPSYEDFPPNSLPEGRIYGKKDLPKRYIKEVLGEDIPLDPVQLSEGLLIDLGCSANLFQEGLCDGNLQGRTGTPRYMARSITRGTLLELRPSMGFDTMPELTGEALELYNKAYPNREYENRRAGLEEVVTLTKPPAGVTFKHRLFHDAESVFRVLAYLLIRVVPSGSTESELTVPYADACGDFFNSHGSRADGLVWPKGLHSGLMPIKTLLDDMWYYLAPEWAYRKDLKREDHAHEAMMRLLLREIIRMKSSGAHIPLNPELRSLPREYC